MDPLRLQPPIYIAPLLLYSLYEKYNNMDCSVLVDQPLAYIDPNPKWEVPNEVDTRNRRLKGRWFGTFFLKSEIQS